MKLCIGIKKLNNFPLEFIVIDQSITDTNDIANHFNNFFLEYWSKFIFFNQTTR